MLGLIFFSIEDDFCFLKKFLTIFFQIKLTFEENDGMCVLGFVFFLQTKFDSLKSEFDKSLLKLKKTHL